MKTMALIVVCVVIAACAAGFVIMEHRKMNVRKIALIAVMTAMSVAGRFVFAALPGFKPVTAVVVLCGMYLGADAGFICGALSALISNCYFGQGPWTPFQMFSWGILGFIAGIIARQLRENKVVLAIYGIVSGVLFSFIMDVWTVLSKEGNFNLSRYLAAVAAAAQFTVIYAVSNVIFLLLFAKPIGKMLERIKVKYEL